jgi:hypothetical protein
MAPAPAPAPQPPLPNPPSPSGPPEGRPIPIPGGGGPTYVPGSGTTIISDATVRSAVSSTDPACYPDWDSSGRCRVFEITAAIDGRLTASVRLIAPSVHDVMDLFLVDLDRAYVVSYSGLAAEEASLPVTAGSSYGIAVMAYTAPTEFELHVDVRP